jgi:hypothetical protein
MNKGSAPVHTIICKNLFSLWKFFKYGNGICAIASVSLPLNDRRATTPNGDSGQLAGFRFAGYLAVTRSRILS